MTDGEFRTLQATMPWRQHAMTNGRHTVIQVIDTNGAEVPLLTITAFVTFITARLAARASGG